MPNVRLEIPEISLKVIQVPLWPGSLFARFVLLAQLGMTRSASMHTTVTQYMTFHPVVYATRIIRGEGYAADNQICLCACLFRNHAEGAGTYTTFQVQEK